MSVVATLCAIAFAAAYHLNLFAQPDLHTWDSGTRSPVESGDSKSGKSLIMGGEHNSAQSDAIQSSTTQLAAGSSFSDCPSLCPEMVVIPAGEFLMGSSTEEAARGSNEGPQHAVELGRPIAVGKYEIKFSEWDLCVVEGGCLHKPDDEGEGRANRPVYNVSWNDVQQYVSWLRKKTGRNYRLLSEAEWEYAARAGSLTPFSTGQKIAMSEANFDWNYTGGAAHATATRQMALDAGSFKPNAFGLYDMHGNVWEWTQDCYEESYQSAPVDGSAKTSGDCSGRVVRGGAWSSDSGYLRSATRFKYSPDSRGNDTGFRVARSFE